MLRSFAALRLAPNHSPHWERRVCWMSPRSPIAPQGQNPEEEPLEMRFAREVQDVLNERISFDSNSVRTRIEGAIEHEPLQSEKVLEKCKQVHGFFGDVRDLASVEFSLPTGELTTVRRYVDSPHVSAEDKRQFTESMDYLDQKMGASEKWRGVLETITQWDKGELDLKEFREAMTLTLRGFDDIDNSLESLRVQRLGEEQITIIENFAQQCEKSWNSVSPAKRFQWRNRLNQQLNLKRMLTEMEGALEQWKQVNELVKNELVKTVLPKQRELTDAQALETRKALDTTFKQWNENQISLPDFRAQIEQIYTMAGIGGKTERLAEIDKVIAQWGAADENQKRMLKERLHHTIGVQHVETHLNRQLQQWAEKRMQAILNWESNRLSNREFLELMRQLYAFTEDPDAVAKLAKIEAARSEYEGLNIAAGNVSMDLEWRDALKRAIQLGATKKILQRWAISVARPTVVQTPIVSPATAPAQTPQTTPPQTPAAAAGQPPARADDKKTDDDDEKKKKNLLDDGDTGEKKKPEKDKPADLNPVPEVHAHAHGLFKKVGIEFYSINDVLGALKRVKEAYGHAWHERGTLKQTGLADSMGKMIPGWSYMGGEVKLTLEKANDSEKNKETNEFKEYLEQRNFTFRELFEGHGEASMAHLQGEPPKARAVLEYAASRGWLYDINTSKNKGQMTVLGYDLRKVCSDWGADPQDRKLNNYFLKLIGQNGSGIEDEKGKGKKKEHFTEKSLLFINAINKSLDDLNYWEGVGIAQRAMERGLAGEISPWIALTVLRRLRDDPVARKYVTDQVLDQFGLIGYVHTARTLGGLKTGRAGIGKWATDPNFDKEKFGEIDKGISGICYYTTLIEKKILTAAESAGSTISPKELDRMTAKVLAAELVELPPDGSGKYISIFDNDLIAYANDIIEKNQQGDSRVGDEDDDYYVNVSDVILADREVFKRIFNLSGSGKFSNAPKPHYLALTMLNHLRLLQNNHTQSATDNYKTLAKKKLEAWIAGWLTESRGGPAEKEQLPREFKGNGYKSNFMIFCLIQEGFIDFELVKASCNTFSKGAPLLAQSLMVQLADKENPNPYQDAARQHLATVENSPYYVKPQTPAAGTPPVTPPTPPTTPPAGGGGGPGGTPVVPPAAPIPGTGGPATGGPGPMAP